MRIAQIAPPFLTVPPDGYGGIELVVAHLADGLVARGHDVTLFASGGSHTSARLHSPLERAPGPTALGDGYLNLAHLVDAYQRCGGFDVIHDHTALGVAIAAAADVRPAVVHTLHGPWTDSAKAFYGRVDHRVALVAISEAQRSMNDAVKYAGVVPNGIDVDSIPFRDDKDDYLVFVGRCNPEKGPEIAVEVARKVGLPLVMVVKRSEPHEQAHWEAVVEPVLTGDEAIHDDVAPGDLAPLVAGARAMVFPIQWEEPFGLVITEAMACGTPVITRPYGAATELVDDGVTGFLCETVDDMVDAVGRLDTISAAACRERVERRFSKDAMVDGYGQIFERVAGAA